MRMAPMGERVGAGVTFMPENTRRCRGGPSAGGLLGVEDEAGALGAVRPAAVVAEGLDEAEARGGVHPREVVAREEADVLGVDARRAAALRRQRDALVDVGALDPALLPHAHAVD